MKNGSSNEKLSSTGTDIASRVKNLFSGSPLSRRKRTMSLSAIQSNHNQALSAVLGIPLGELVIRDGLSVPYIVTKIVQRVEEEGLDQVGIYRINGNVKVIEKLRTSFDRDGDANFADEDIASVAGLLKLFLRELPDGVIPEILMPHFVSLHQSYPGEASQESLEALQHCLKFLPEPNYNTLKFLIKHLAKVVEHTENNKMTAVSLAIVFGPNLFHCGSGLEALKMQGYSNSIVCRMIQYHDVLFVKTRKRDGSEPPKPVPYAEHVKEKRKNQENIPPEGEDHLPLSDTNKLDKTHSERSIDEAIQERNKNSSVNLSHDALPLSGTSPPHPIRSLSMDSAKPLFVRPLSEGFVNVSISEEEGESGAGFQRRNAKRGMTYRPRSDEVSSLDLFKGLNGSPDLSSRPQVNKRPSQLVALNSREENSPFRTESSFSIQSSPGTSPPTSPATPSAMKSVVGATVKDFLFKPQESPPPPKRNDSGSTKQNVYGLLLPKTSSNDKTHTKEDQHEEMDTLPSVQMRKRSRQISTDDAPPQGVVRRRTRNMLGQRNRKSALYGADIPEDFSATHDALQDMKVQLVSVSPEHEKNTSGGDVFQSHTGKVTDLIRQLSGDQDEERGVVVVGGEVHGSQSGSVSESVDGRKRLSSNAFEMFEKNGRIMGMGNPGSKTRSSSVLTTVTNKTSHGSTLEDTGALSPTDEEPPSSIPVFPAGRRSTTISDDVFFSPAHCETEHREKTSLGDHTLAVKTDESQFSISKEFDKIKHSNNLVHLTLSRPKGPHRRKPRRSSSSNQGAEDREEVPSEGRTSKSLSDDPNHRTSVEFVRTLPSLPNKGSRGSPTTYSKLDWSVSLPQDKRKESSPLSQQKQGISVDTVQTTPFNNIHSKRKARATSLDLTALGPARKQEVSQVQRGWQERDAETKEAMKRINSTSTIKEYSRKIHELKNQIREFEADFVDQHGRRPSNHEKSPIQDKLLELAKLKKTYKEMKEIASEESLAQTAPADISKKMINTSMEEEVNKKTRKTSMEAEVSKKTSVEGELSKKTKKASMEGEVSKKSRNSRVEEEVGKKTGEVSKKTTTSEEAKTTTSEEGEEKRHAEAPQPSSPLEEILNKIMSTLESRRKGGGRPEDMESMDESQIQEEKHAIQKVLLNFEKTHGRPQTRADKEVMRPLYDRYRAVKRLCSASSSSSRGGQSNSKSSVSTSNVTTTQESSLGTLNSSTVDTLPSITLLQSGMDISDMSKSGEGLLSEMRGASSSTQKKVGTSKRKSEGRDDELSSAPLNKLKEQQALLLTQKFELRKLLRDFEDSFSAKYGRSVAKEDRKSMEKEYSQYKSIKTKLRTIETLIAKKDPQETV